MRFFLPIIIILFLFVGFTRSFTELRDVLYDSWVQAEIANIQRVQLDPTLYNLDRMSSATLRQLSAALYQKATISEEKAEKAKGLCEASQILRSALKKDLSTGPLAALAEAELGIILAGFDCGQLSKAGFLMPELSSAEKKLQLLVDELIKRHPSDPEVLLAVGRVANRYQHAEQAVNAFSAFLRVKINPSIVERQLLRQWLVADDNITKALPDLLPIVLLWSEEIYALLDNRKTQIAYYSLPFRQSLYRINSLLSDKQNLAFNLRRQEFKDRKLPVDIYFRELVKLYSVAGNDYLRSQVDFALAGLSNAHSLIRPQEQALLSLRSKLNSLDIVPAYKDSDTRPEVGALIRWRWQGDILLDGRRNSLGFYVAPRQSVAMIEVSSYAGITPTEMRSFTIYSSEDNNRWVSRDSHIAEVLPLELDGLTTLVFRFKEPIAARFFKVHHLSKGGEARIWGRPGDLIDVYGIKLK